MMECPLDCLSAGKTFQFTQRDDLPAPETIYRTRLFTQSKCLWLYAFLIWRRTFLCVCSCRPLIIDRQRHRLRVSCVQTPVTEATSAVTEASACQPLIMHSLSVAQGHFGIEASGDVWIELTDLRTADMLGLFNKHPSFIEETRRPPWSPSVCDGVSPRVLICLPLSCVCSWPLLYRDGNNLLQKQTKNKNQKSNWHPPSYLH